MAPTPDLGTCAENQVQQKKTKCFSCILSLNFPFLSLGYTLTYIYRSGT